MISNELLIYLTAFIGPFVQEDAAILGAVTAFLHPDMDTMASGPLIVVAMLSGLIVSDLWKYWIGWAGRTQSWAQKMARQKSVEHVGSKMVAHPGKTLLFARFVPGTRIPAYVAAGFFAVPFGRFAFWVVTSAFAYTAAAWALLRTVGMVAGKTGQLYLAGALIGGLVIYAIIGAVKSRKSVEA
jgi:membrane protein DedA with SNARE-associated domain